MAADASVYFLKDQALWKHEVETLLRYRTIPSSIPCFSPKPNGFVFSKCQQRKLSLAPFALTAYVRVSPVTVALYLWLLQPRRGDLSRD